MANLRLFRRRVSLLKKQGLLPDRTDKGNKLDARYITPSAKVRGKTLEFLVNKKYDDVASGKATAIKVSPTRLKQFRKAGYETSQGKVLIPHSATDKVKLVNGEVEIHSKSGIERIQIPIPFHNLPQYFRDIQKDADKINRMKRRNEYFGFKFFGNNSSALYSNIAHAIEDLERYSAVVAAASRIKQQEIYKNLEIVRVKASANWVFPSQRRRMISAKVNAKRQKAFRKKLKSKPGQLRKYKEASAERNRRYRARLIKGNGNRLRKYRKQARIRAQKARDKSKKKKK